MASLVEAASAYMERPDSGWLHTASSMTVAAGVVLSAVGLVVMLLRLPTRWLAWALVPLIIIVLFFLMFGVTFDLSRIWEVIKTS